MTKIRVLEFAEALRVVEQHVGRAVVRSTETVELLQSLGRVLAQEVCADRDQPPFDRSTRDGFAVQAAEWTAGKRLQLAGQVRAGQSWAGELAAGAAIEIMTGAPLPAGADAVAMVEHAQQSEGQVQAAAGRVLRVGENVVPRGSEARSGDILLVPGTLMGAAEIAVAASSGCGSLGVYARPEIAIVATGDELVEVHEVPAAQQIRNSNGYALAAMVIAAGGDARRSKIARDTREDLRERIAQGLASDLLLLSGGVSAGKYDLVEEVLAEFGAEFFFTGVKMQPGKPVVFGRLPRGERGGASTHVSEARRGAPKREEWTYFFGLPGNPVSTQVTFHCFVEPLLRAMCGASAAGPRFVQATLAEEARGKAGLTRVLPARLTFDLVRPEVRLVSWQGSGDVAANARANCYAVLPDGKDLKAGDPITVLLR